MRLSISFYAVAGFLAAGSPSTPTAPPSASMPDASMSTSTPDAGPDDAMAAADVLAPDFPPENADDPRVKTLLAVAQKQLALGKVPGLALAVIVKGHLF